MTPDNRTPRKRRRRRRRTGAEGQPLGNGNGPAPGNEAARPQQFADGGSGAGGKRRRRSRRGRGGREEGGRPQRQDNGGGSAPIDVAPGELVAAAGVLFVKQNGAGLLVDPANNYYVQPGDTIVPRSTIERLHLLPGLLLGGSARRTGNGLELMSVETIEGMPVEEYRESRRPFSELISIDPNEMFKLETEPERLTTRVLDLLAPVGKGQRCLVVAPPKAGKTTLLKDIAHGINTNHPEVVLFVLLVDERPEEVTDFRRSVAKGEVVASSSDETADSHIHLAEIILERARRLVETKKDVVILCDSITRMSR
ncbi:MAG TPA: transcription termination factor Rho, partial [Thermoanaerobaculia bacterium]|nr:transcription termination factor Rho [Thermoanaerobaculia bacterium]